MMGHPAYANLKHSLEQSVLKSEPYRPFSPNEVFSWTRELLHRLPDLESEAPKGWWREHDYFVIDDHESFKGFISHLAQKLQKAENSQSPGGSPAYCIGLSRAISEHDDQLVVIWYSV